MKIDMDKNKEQFIKRLTELRISKGVSARDMSLSIGQSPGYINNIENGVNLPSMSIFFGPLSSVGVGFSESRSFIAFEGIFMFRSAEGFFGHDK